MRFAPASQSPRYRTKCYRPNALAQPQPPGSQAPTKSKGSESPGDRRNQKGRRLLAEASWLGQASSWILKRGPHNNQILRPAGDHHIIGLHIERQKSDVPARL